MRSAGYSAKDLRRMREALHTFAQAYSDYIKSPSPQGRSRVLHVMPDADEALAVGGGGFTFTDSPAMGAYRQSRSGLAATAFLHEQLGWEETHGRPTPVLVLEGLERADSILEAEERKVAEDRANPLYWLDRAFRTALMLPAYLVSVLVGESVSKIDRSAWGFPLRVLAVVADGLAVYFAGTAFGWW